MKKKNIKTGLIIFSVLLFVSALVYFSSNLNKSTKVKYNDIEITIIGDKYKTELFNDILYFYIPINSDMEENKYMTEVAGDKFENKQVENFFSSIDTFIPGERLHEFNIEGITLNVSVIVE